MYIFYLQINFDKFEYYLKCNKKQKQGITCGFNESHDSRGKERSIITPLFHFHPPHKHLDFSHKITANST